MSVASYGESDGNSEYVDSPKNLPTRLANTLQLKIHILELQHMHEVAEDNIDDIAQPTYLFTQPDELDPKELANDGTTMDENHQYNGASPRNVTQPSLSKSPLTYALVRYPVSDATASLLACIVCLHGCVPEKYELWSMNAQGVCEVHPFAQVRLFDGFTEDNFWTTLYNLRRCCIPFIGRRSLNGSVQFIRFSGVT